jgi:hypothetical protein
MRLFPSVIAVTCAVGLASAALAQPPAPAGPRGPGAGGGIPQMGGDPGPAPLLFHENWNTVPMAQPMTQAHLANAGLTLHLYGDTAGIRKSVHPTENYTYTGESVTNWGITFSDRAAYWDLSRNGKVKLKTRNSGYRFTHIMLKTADGKWFVSEEGNPESTFWIEREYILADLRWRVLMMTDTPTNASNQRQPDPKRVPIIPLGVAMPDLAKVDEIGFTDLMPGGWIPSTSRINAFDLYGKKVPR